MRKAPFWGFFNAFNKIMLSLLCGLVSYYVIQATVEYQIHQKINQSIHSHDALTPLQYSSLHFSLIKNELNIRDIQISGYETYPLGGSIKDLTISGLQLIPILFPSWTKVVKDPLHLRCIEVKGAQLPIEDIQRMVQHVVPFWGLKRWDTIQALIGPKQKYSNIDFRINLESKAHQRLSIQYWHHQHALFELKLNFELIHPGPLNQLLNTSFVGGDLYFKNLSVVDKLFKMKAQKSKTPIQDYRLSLKKNLNQQNWPLSQEERQTLEKYIDHPDTLIMSFNPIFPIHIVSLLNMSAPIESIAFNTLELNFQAP